MAQRNHRPIKFGETVPSRLEM